MTLRSAARAAGVPLPDEAQTFEREQIVHRLDVARTSTDERREPTGGDYLRRAAQFGNHAFEDAIHQSEIAVVQPALQVLDGVDADDTLGLAHFDALQARGAGEERVGGDADAGRDGAADVFALRRDDVEGGGGAEVHHDAWPAVLRESGHAVHDAVGADFGGIIYLDRHARLHARLDE